MKHNSLICFFALHPIFNKDEVPEFENFGIDNSSLLYSTFALNHKEIAGQLSYFSDILFCFDDKDKEFLPNGIFQNHPVFYFNSEKRALSLKILAEKYFSNYQNNLVVILNSIGIALKEVKQVFNLLSIEDETMIIGKSSEDRIAFVGFNNFNHELFSEIDWSNFHYHDLLLKASRHEHFLHVLNDFLVVYNINDFKKLYIELSKKESLSYCSQNIHEKFTNLFIEYKELLK